jgi:sodium/hydrogen antiporter
VLDSRRVYRTLCFDLFPGKGQVLPFRSLYICLLLPATATADPDVGIVISLLAGVLFGPVAKWIRPDEYALHNQVNLEFINLYICRLVLGVQLVIAGIQLPPKYIKKEWKSLAYLLGPGMTVMWLVTAMLIWALVPNLTFLYALAVGACVTPTDPILSNSILKGKFADKHIPRQLQKIVIAESGLNDGLGYPFLFLPLYLITYIGQGAHAHTAGKAVGL